MATGTGEIRALYTKHINTQNPNDEFCGTAVKKDIVLVDKAGVVSTQVTPLSTTGDGTFHA